MTFVLTLAFVLGIAAIAYGCWLAWKPAGFIVGGMLAMLVPVFYVRGQWRASSSP